MTLGEGAVIADRFRLVGELGRGGMGSVWRAHHLSLDIPCAVKFIHDHGLDAQGRARFESEARAAAKLRCSSVVHFNELQRRTTTPENASRILDALGDVDVRAELSQVKVPTLVLHSRGDQIVPISDGMELAAGIEGARFVSIDSSNHMLLRHEPGWQRLCAEIDRFAGSLTPS